MAAIVAVVLSSLAALAAAQPAGITYAPVGAPIGGGVSLGNWSKPYTGSELAFSYAVTNTSAGVIEQIHLFPATKDSRNIYVQWIVSEGFPYGHSRNSRPMTVFYGNNPRYLSQYTTTTPHNYSFGLGTDGEYTSGEIYTAVIGPLRPSTTYYYTIEGKTPVKSFMSAPRVGSGYGMSISLMADVGVTVNSTVTYARALASKSSFVAFVGDLNYADSFGAYPPYGCTPYNGTVADEDYVGTNGYGPFTCGVGGFVWDLWGRAIQDLASAKPIMFVPGNHELELVPPFNEMEPFKVYSARIPGLYDTVQAPFGGFDSYVVDHTKLPNYGVPSKGSLFYSVDIGLVHILGLSTYSPFSKYTHQWQFIEDDLCSVNRKVTPWLMVMGHTPMYNTNSKHYLEGEPLRRQFEDWLYKSQVDIVVAGHVHAYERSFPVYRYELNQCGPTYVTLGDGGNIEGMAGPFLDPQPVYSAYREYSFGFADLKFDSVVLATYTWYRNQNNSLVVSDTVKLLNKVNAYYPRNKTTCRKLVPTLCSLQA